MKAKKMKLALVIAIAAAGVFTSNGYAQVTIGSGIEPHPGALLDLKQSTTAGAANSSKGLLLPRVALTDLDNLYPMFLSGYTGYTKATEDARHIGLAVYNITDDCLHGFYKGMYVWDGTTWLFQSQEIPDCPAEPAMINIQDQLVCTGASEVTLTASSDIPNPVFKWYADNSTPTVLFTGASYPVTISSFPTSFYVSVSGTGYSENAPDNRKAVTVTEASSTVTPTPDISIANNKQVLRTIRSANTDVADFTDLTTAVSVTPEPGFTYSWKVTKLYTTGVDDLSTAFTSYPTDDALNGTSLSFTANGTGTQVIGGAYKVEVTATSPVNCSLPATVSVNIYVGCGALTADNNTWIKFMCHNLEADKTADPFTPSRDINGSYFQFGSKTAALTQKAGDDESAFESGTWNSTAPIGQYGNGASASSAIDQTGDNVKNSTYDPCPSGYRVPTIQEWSNLIGNANNVKSDKNADGTTWGGAPMQEQFTGSTFGSALFLPAAGFRNGSGALSGRGNYGFYWSATWSSSSHAYTGFFSSGSNGGTANHDRGTGFSLRCIATE